MTPDTEVIQLSSLRRFAGKTIASVDDSAANQVEIMFTDGSALRVEAESACRLAYYAPKDNAAVVEPLRDFKFSEGGDVQGNGVKAAAWRRVKKVKKRVQEDHMPKFADGVEFTIGMPLVFSSGKEMATDDSFEVVQHELPDGPVRKVVCHMIHRKSSCVFYDLKRFYSSQAARVAEQVRRLEQLKVVIDEEIAYLQAGGDPLDCARLVDLM